MRYLSEMPPTRFLIGMKEPNDSTAGQAKKCSAGQFRKFFTLSFPIAFFGNYAEPIAGRENFAHNEGWLSNYSRKPLDDVARSQRQSRGLAGNQHRHNRS